MLMEIIVYIISTITVLQKITINCHFRNTIVTLYYE